MSLHALTHVSGVIIVLSLVALIALTVHAYRTLQTHRAAEAAAFQARGASAFSVVALGLTLPTLLRVMALACAISGVAFSVIGIAAAWLVVDPERDSGLRNVSPLGDPADLSRFTAEGQLCMTLAKLCPSGYCYTKTFSYLFFFLKSRTVRPTEKLHWIQLSVLLMTLSFFGFGTAAVWLVNGDANTIDAVCTFDVPLWQMLLMGAADLVFSAIYLALFVHPLYQTITANRIFKARTNATAIAAVQLTRIKVAPVDSSMPQPQPPQPPTQSASENASTAARGSALEIVMRRNMYSCAVGIASTIVCLGLVIIAHLMDEPYLRKASWALGAIDSTVANLCIAHLMHKKEPPAAAARAQGRDDAKAGAGAAAKDSTVARTATQLPAPQPTVRVHLTERTRSLELRSPASLVLQQHGSTPRVSSVLTTTMHPQPADASVPPPHPFMVPSDESASNPQADVMPAAAERDSS